MQALYKSIQPKSMGTSGHYQRPLVSPSLLGSVAFSSAVLFAETFPELPRFSLSHDTGYCKMRTYHATSAFPPYQEARFTNY
jgi:hypothetical protein